MNMTKEPMLREAMASFFDGYRPVPARAFEDPKTCAKVQSLVEAVFNTKRLTPAERQLALIRAQGTADFPYLTGAIIEREILNGFGYVTETIEKIFKRGNRLNFNTKRVFRLDGGDQLLEEVTEDGSYQSSKLTETEFEYAIKLYGRTLAITLQMLANDDLDAFSDIPIAMGRGARFTRQKFMTALLMTTTGWKAALFSGGGAPVGGQTAVSTLPLTAANLGTALKEMALYKDANGNHVKVRPRYLVVSPSLEQTAHEITEAPALATIVTGLAATNAKTTELTTMVNYIKRFNLETLVDSFMVDVATSNTIGATGWGLFCDPKDQPAAEFGVWNVAPEPQVMVKTSDQRPVSGGADPFNTTFEPEGRLFKVRDAHGGVALFPQARWLSNGQ